MGSEMCIRDRDIVGAGARAEGSLVMEAAVRAFDAHISDSAW